MAEAIQEHKIEKLPLVENGKLKGLITIKDIEKVLEFPHAAKDEYGRLLAAAAIGLKILKSALKNLLKRVSMH